MRTNPVFERVKDKLVEFYTPSTMSKDELEVLMLFAVFKPQEFKNMIKGVYSQTIKQLDSIAGMDKRNQILVNRTTRVISQQKKRE